MHFIRLPGMSEYIRAARFDLSPRGPAAVIMLVKYNRGRGNPGISLGPGVVRMLGSMVHGLNTSWYAMRTRTRIRAHHIGQGGLYKWYHLGPD